MSIERRSTGKYLARWRDPSGAQRKRSFAKKIDAERWLASVTIDTLSGRYVDPRAGRETVSQYAQRWTRGQPWRDSTRMSREATLAKHILPAFGVMSLAAVRRSDVQAWVGRMASAGLAPATVEAYYRVLAELMRSAVRDRLIAESPCSTVKLPTAERAAAGLVPLRSEQVEQLASAVLPRYRALVIVSAALALRQGEACGLTVDRVDFLRRRVTIDRQVTTGRRADECKFGPVKTPASNRTIPLPESVALVLASHLAEYGPGPSDLIFTNTRGGMLARPTWHAALNAAARRVSVDASSHDLRHYGASLLIAAGCSPRAVAAFLGHKNASTTLNTYAHLWPSDEGRMAAAIDGWLGVPAVEGVPELCPPSAQTGS